MDEIIKRAFEYYGPLAFLLIAFLWLARRYVAALAKIEQMHADRLVAEREAAKVGEAMRDTMFANTTALMNATEVMKAGANRRGGDA